MEDGEAVHGSGGRELRGALEKLWARAGGLYDPRCVSRQILAGRILRAWVGGLLRQREGQGQRTPVGIIQIEPCLRGGRALVDKRKRGAPAAVGNQMRHGADEVRSCGRSLLNRERDAADEHGGAHG